MCLQVQNPIKNKDWWTYEITKITLDPSKPRVKSNCFETDGCIDLQRSRIKEPVSDICKFFAAADADNHNQLKSLFELPRLCPTP